MHESPGRPSVLRAGRYRQRNRFRYVIAAT